LAALDVLTLHSIHHMKKQEAITTVETLHRPSSGSNSHIFERFILLKCAENSKPVLPGTFEDMKHCGPCALDCLQVTEIACCGHAPALNVSKQLALVAGFIEAASV
jgi:hypothetical protein